VVFRRTAVSNYYMKHKFLILIIAIFVSSFSNEKFKKINYPRVNNKILLIEYNEDADLKVLKDYKRKKKGYRYMHGLTFSDANYNTYSKILYVDEPITISDSSKIIFWDIDDEIMDISLPFHYSDISLDRFINDSTIQITFNNKKHILESGQEFIDSITSIEKEGKLVVQLSRKFHINNHGLIFKKNIITEKERWRRMDEEQRIRDSIDLDDLEKMDKKK